MDPPNGRLSCFFCLRSNSRKYSNPRDESKSDFCANAEEPMSSFHEFSLRNLYRFLNLLHSDKEEKDFNDLKMPICENCFRLTTEFNELYYLLEEIKLRLNWCIHKMLDVMTEARSESSLSTPVKREEEEEVDDGKVLEVWRIRTFDQMKTFTGASFPRILLHRNNRKRASSFEHTPEDERTSEMMMTMDKKVTPVPEDKIIDEEEMTPVHSQYTMVNQHHFKEEIVENFEDHDPADASLLPSPVFSEMQVFTENSELEIKMECDTKVEESCRESEERCSVQKKARKRRYPAFKRKNKSKRLNKTKCDYCSFVCGADRRKQLMLKHQARFHPEHLLLNKSEMKRHHQASGFKPQRFRRLLTEKVFPKFVKHRGRHALCSQCGLKYRSRNMGQNVASIKQHLIFQHKVVLKEDLKIVLKKEKTGSRTRIVHRRDCLYCSFKSHSIRGSRSMMNHLLRIHPEHYLIDEKDKAAGLWHEQFRRVLTTLVYPKFVVSSVGHQKSCSCSLCGKECKGMNATHLVRTHLIFHHKAALKDSFKVVLEDPLLQEKLRRNKKAPKRPSNSETEKKYSSYCSYCQIKFRSKSYKRSLTLKHLAQFHPERLLFNESEKDQAEASKVLTILTDILFPKYTKTMGQRASCLLCETNCGINFLLENEVSVRKHLILFHKAVLQEDVRVIVEDKNLQVTQYFSSCPYCHFKCCSSNHESSLERHLVRFHPQHFLIEGEETQNKLSNPQLQFQRILAVMVFPKFVSITGQNTTKCLMCGMNYTVGQRDENIFSVKRHILLEHKAELRESIKVVLQDPELQVKLESSASGNGVSCSCGAYFSRDEEQILRHHENFHCVSVKSQEKVNCLWKTFDESSRVEGEDTGVSSGGDPLEQN